MGLTTDYSPLWSRLGVLGPERWTSAFIELHSRAFSGSSGFDCRLAFPLHTSGGL